MESDTRFYRICVVISTVFFTVLNILLRYFSITGLQETPNSHSHFIVRKVWKRFKNGIYFKKTCRNLFITNVEVVLVQNKKHGELCFFCGYILFKYDFTLWVHFKHSEIKFLTVSKLN